MTKCKTIRGSVVKGLKLSDKSQVCVSRGSFTAVVVCT